MAREMKDSGIEWIGEIPKEWDTIKIKYTSWLKGRIGWQGLTASEYTDEGPFLVTGTDFQNGIVNWSSCSHISKERFGEDSDIHIKEGDLLITKDGTVGKVAIAKNCPDEVSLNSGVLLIRNVGNYKYYDEYLYYVLFSDEFWGWYTLSQIGQSTIKHLYQAQFYSFEYTYPSYEEQALIANFLDSKCDCIDAVIEQTRASIEEYKKLKQAVITQAVTKGIRPDRPMKDSGVEWIGDIPANWSVYRIANLYDERNESGLDELPILTVSINTGISDHEVADDEQKRVFVRSEDKTKYKRVYIGDLSYNMMRAWQGAFGAVRIDGMVSPAYVVAKPKNKKMTDNRYMEALLRTPSAVEEMHRYSYGITDFRLRLYWPKFKNIRVCLPSYEEQKEIADYIDEKTLEWDTIIEKKKQLIVELENFKKSVIFEYVTGKKEVSA